MRRVPGGWFQDLKDESGINFVGGAALVCKQCPIGYINAGTTNADCASCPSGKFNVAPGSTTCPKISCSFDGSFDAAMTHYALAEDCAVRATTKVPHSNSPTKKHIEIAGNTDTSALKKIKLAEAEVVVAGTTRFFEVSAGAFLNLTYVHLSCKQGTWVALKSPVPESRACRVLQV